MWLACRSGGYGLKCLAVRVRHWAVEFGGYPGLGLLWLQPGEGGSVDQWVLRFHLNFGEEFLCLILRCTIRW